MWRIAMSWGLILTRVSNSRAASLQKLRWRYQSISAMCASVLLGSFATASMSDFNCGSLVGGVGAGVAVAVGSGVIEMPATPVPCTGAPTSRFGLFLGSFLFTW